MNAVKPTRVFTRAEPCTKVHIWNAFITPNGLAPIMVVVSRGEIGLNAPKFMKREGYLTAYTDKSVDYYSLTPSGVQWLRDGLKRHLELHPDDANSVQHLNLLNTPAPRKRPVRKAA